MTRAWIGLGVAAALAACTPYAARPVGLRAYPAALDARRLDEKPAAAAWTGAELLAAALARNAAVAEARAKWDVAIAAVRTARATPGPSLTLTAEYAKETPRWGYGGAADIPLDVGARRSTRVGTAELQALQAGFDYAEAIWAVRAALAKARADLTAADTEAALADQAAMLRRQRLEALERKVAAGEDDRFISLTAQTELAAAERRLAEARGRREQALASLAKALGVSPTAVRGLAFAPAPGVPPLDDLATWRRDAVLGRSDVLRALADYDLAEAALKLEVAKQYPAVSLGPGYMWDHGVAKLPFNLNLALPPLDLNRNAIAGAEAGRAAAGRSLEAVQANVLAGVDTAVAGLAAARDVAARVQARELPSAQRTAANTSRSLQAGAADRADDLAARAAEIDAQLNLNEAQRAERNAVADLEDAVRRVFDPVEAAVLRAAVTPPGEAR